MNKLTFLCFIFGFWLFSCQSDPKQPADGSTATDAAGIANGAVQLTCETIHADEVSPKAAIYALVRENKIKIGEVVTNDCKVISTDEYAQFKIPAEAIAAAGGWWAGSGDYFYIVEAEKEYVVMKGSLDEMMEGEMEYVRVAGLQK